MAYQLPVGDADSISRALLKSYRLLRQEIATRESLVHGDITGTPGGDFRNPTTTAYLVTAANASDTATLRTLCRDLYRVYSTHIADTEAHKVADSTNTVSVGLPAEDADQTALNTFMNELKADYNAHRSQTGVHCNNDSGNAVAAVDASDAATSYTLANEIKTDLNAHIQASLTSPGVELVG
ncbi:hypothetical protein [Sorangium sp. So ce233]|uniref:hypothetical protein n=1 Tax=Sorangium sp. So ce233 TaxID=3133290 RepID=UPI003F634158